MPNFEKTCQACGEKYHDPESILTKTRQWRICGRNHFWFQCVCGSTLILRHGDVDWFQLDQDNNLTRISNLKNFPLIPSSVDKILRTIDDPTSSSKIIANTIRLDPITAATILKIANNMRYSTSTKISSLEHAISYIGRKEAKLLILVSAMTQISVKTKKFNAEAFWKNAFQVGKIAEILAKKLSKKISDDEAYLAGALCNIGKLVTAYFFPELCDRLSETRSILTTNDLNWSEREKAILGFSHCKIGELAGKKWGLPLSFLEVIEYHHTVPDSEFEAQNLDLLQIVSLANQLSHRINNEDSEIDPYLLSHSLQVYKINSNQYDLLANEIELSLCGADVFSNNDFLDV